MVSLGLFLELVRVLRLSAQRPKSKSTGMVWLDQWKFQRRAITLLCKGLYWSIWIARNRLIFKSKALDWDMIFYLTFHRLAFWLKSSVRNFSYTGSDLFRNPEYIMNWTN
jgi:hypothetical protein